jgi:putative hemolysin
VSTANTEIVVLVLCVILSAFFSAAEMALTTLSAYKVRNLQEQNPFIGRALTLWESNHASVLATILIGNTLVSITAGSVATDYAAHFFSTVTGLPLAIGAMTLVLLVAGEILPKTLARAYADQVAAPLMTGVAVFHGLFYPVTWLLSRVLRMLVTLLGGRLRNGPQVTEEDIEYIITHSQHHGGIDKDKREMLTSVFEFTDTEAREIMVPRTEITALPADCPYEEVVRVCAESGFSRIPVYEHTIDRVVGIFFAKHLIAPASPEERVDFLRKRMRPPAFVPEAKKISELLKEFQRDRRHMAIVVNEFGGTEGIVTLEDVVEELLGEIRDEFDEEEPLIKPRPEGGYLADARIHITDLEDALHIRFPDERAYESLGGFLMEAAGDVPRQGWTFPFQGFDFTVVSANLTRVNKVHILPRTPAAPHAPADAA